MLEYTSEAIANLEVIWDWNAGQFGADHADRYVAFLKIQSDKLTVQVSPGRSVPTRDCYRYAVIKRRNKGHGHIVVFETEGTVLRLLRYFHTSRDWQTHLIEDLP